MMNKDTINYVYVDDFISGHCGSLQKIAQEHHYMAFSIACVLIEFMGKCLDDVHDFNYYDNKVRSSYKQFTLAIDELMPKYSAVHTKYDLYATMRNGLQHAFVPKAPVWLRQRHTATEPNLTFKNDRLHIIIEELADDVSSACQELIRRINNGDLKHKKITDPILRIT